MVQEASVQEASDGHSSEVWQRLSVPTDEAAPVDYSKEVPGPYLMNADVGDLRNQAGVGMLGTATPPPAPRSRAAIAIMALVASLTLVVGGYFLLGSDSGTESDSANGPQPVPSNEGAISSSAGASSASVPTGSAEAAEPGTPTSGSETTSVSPTTVSPNTSPAGAAPTSETPTTAPPTTAAVTTLAPTTTAPAGTDQIRDGRIIGELARPVRLYREDAFASTVLTELGVNTPLSIFERDRGWYRVEANGTTGWVFGAYVLPAQAGFANFISVDGTVLEPLTPDGQPIAGDYRGGKYAFGRATAVDGRIEIFLPSGRLATVAGNEVREIRN